MQATRHFIGLISGTSADGIDCALVRASDKDFCVSHAITVPYSAHVSAALSRILEAPATTTVADLGKLDVMIGDAFAAAVLQLLDAANHAPEDISAIGSHGQTVFHEPDTEHPFSLQIGDPTRIAQQTGITTVSDFRSADIAAGGQGAPLAPLLHEQWFGHIGDHVGVLNLGGIANLTEIKDGRAIAGFDTGPANGLMNIWSVLTGHGDYDEGGELAASAEPDGSLLAVMKADPYFARPTPKSTGREHFNASWLFEKIGIDPDAVDNVAETTQAVIMSTLCQLTVDTVSDAIAAMDTPATLIVCGGGVHNRELIRRLAARLPSVSIKSSATLDCDPDYLEASLFAWMAARRLDEQPVDTRRFTGATRTVIAGSICLPPGDTIR